MPRAMWAGIAAMSAILPAMDDMRYRVRWRIIGNIAGVCCFLALYFLLPSSIYAYIGVIGGIGVGFSAKYGWQAVFNTFGALSIAVGILGLPGAVFFRIFNNFFGARYCNQRIRTQKRGRSACHAECVRRGLCAAVLPDSPTHFCPLGAL